MVYSIRAAGTSLFPSVLLGRRGDHTVGYCCSVIECELHSDTMMNVFLVTVSAVVLVVALLLGVNLVVSHDHGRMGVDVPGAVEYSWRNDFFGRASACERKWREDYSIAAYMKGVQLCATEHDVVLCRANVRTRSRHASREASWEALPDGCRYDMLAHGGVVLDAMHYVDALHRRSRERWLRPDTWDESADGDRGPKTAWHHE